MKLDLCRITVVLFALFILYTLVFNSKVEGMMGAPINTSEKSEDLKAKTLSVTPGSPEAKYHVRRLKQLSDKLRNSNKNFRETRPGAVPSGIHSIKRPNLKVKSIGSKHAAMLRNPGGNFVPYGGSLAM